MAKDGIYVDPLKVKAISNLLPPRTIVQLQSLQGKANFLHHFVANYAKLAKGLVQLLKKAVPFIRDN